MIRLLCTGCLLSMFAASPSLADEAQWIWSEKEPTPGQRVVLAQEFESGDCRVARLSVVADYCNVSVKLNGEDVATIEDFAPPWHGDVKSLLVEGKNEITIEAEAAHGPSAVAVSLRMQAEDGAQRSIVSDASWSAAKASGEVAWVRWSDPSRDAAIDPFDDYTQWKQALGTSDGADPSKFLVPPGYEIELVRSAQEDEGSWISLEFDPQGRLLVGREDRGILRMTIPPAGDEQKTVQVESINDTLEEVRGLLWAYDSLFVSANTSQALYRLRDTSRDDQFDKIDRLYQAEGGSGHGRNDITLGPDGRIYAIFGDSVDLPKKASDRTSPGAEHRRGQRTKEGHVVRLDPDGANPTLFAAGLRNPFGIAFHPEHDIAFTYDADAEYDMGSSWYRPTRIVQLTDGGDYGWRGVTRSWPPYFPDRADAAPPLLDIGKGSPTSVQFGAKSNFPPRYRDALFVLDWAYGRILAVHMTPRGSGFAARAETFAKGRPFNVTDLDFGPDGAMYVVTGGRKTLSAVYRLRYVGDDERPGDVALPTEHQRAVAAFASESRELRQSVESLHAPQRSADKAVHAAWPLLGRRDPWLRYAARTAIEHQPVDAWQARALSESQPLAAATAMVALVRCGDDSAKREVLDRLCELPLSAFSSTEQLLAIQAAQLGLDEIDTLKQPTRDRLRQRLEPLYPANSDVLNQRLSWLLARLDSPLLVPKTLELLRTTNEQAQRLHYLFVLRDREQGWTPALRRTYFEYLTQMRHFRGGEGMPTFVERIEQDALAALEPSQRPPFEQLLDSSRDPVEQTPLEERPLVNKWKADQLLPELAASDHRPDFDRGAAMFTAAQCARCHRVGTRGGVLGPDLTAIGRRFPRRDILLSILQPSRVVDDAYRRVQVVTTNGRVVAGQVIPSQDYRSPTLTIAPQPHELVEIPKSDIESYTVSPVSVMPEGLLDTLERQEILDLLAWLEAGGDRRHPNYRQ
ncbi:MAG: PQQ-dependent sugar dehydrogenase [Pirellulaceae bacterium]